MEEDEGETEGGRLSRRRNRRKRGCGMWFVSSQGEGGAIGSRQVIERRSCDVEAMMRDKNKCSGDCGARRSLAGLAPRALASRRGIWHGRFLSVIFERLTTRGAVACNEVAIDMRKTE